MFTKVFVLIVLAIATTQAFPGRVVGGEEAPEQGYEYQLSLQYGFGSLHSHVCGASVINARWILTAGHCVTEIPNLPFAHYYVVAGIHNLKDTKVGQTIKVKRNIVHPDYAGGVNPNDIAIMELSQELNLGENVKAVQLPQQDAISTGQSTLSGWGSTSTGWLPSMPKNLQKVDLPILSYEDCAKALVAISGTSAPLATSNVCTGPIETGGLGACSGDSGGPLVIRNGDDVVQIGIVSWGMIPCGSKGAPSVYTRVSAFVNFINEYVQ